MIFRQKIAPARFPTVFTCVIATVQVHSSSVSSCFIPRPTLLLKVLVKTLYVLALLHTKTNVQKSLKTLPKVETLKCGSLLFKDSSLDENEKRITFSIKLTS